MRQAEKLLAQLASKKEKFLRFEEATIEMLSCPFELLTGKVEEREKLICEIGWIDDEIASLCGDGEEGELLRQVIHNSCERGTLSDEYGAVYDAAMEVRAVVSRIGESDLQAAMRLRREQELALLKIKTANQGTGAKAAKFCVPGMHEKTVELGKI